VVTLVGRVSGWMDSIGRRALFKHPWDLTIDNKDNIFITEYGNHRIRKLFRINSTLPLTSPTSWQVTTVAGSGSIGNNDATGILANFYHPYGIAMTPANQILVTDTWNHRIRILSELT